MGDPQVFWRNVFRVLDYQGRSLTYLAQRLNVNPASLYRWRDGSRVAPVEQHQRTADILGVPMALLFLPTELPDGNPLMTHGTEPSEVEEDDERVAV